MPVTWFDGVTVTAELALATAGGPYAQWNDVNYGWNTGLWAPGIVWEDVSDYLRKWSSGRKFRDDGAWQAGSGMFALASDDGRFSADNPACPYIVAGLSSLQPWRPARLRLTVAGTTYDILRMLTKPFDEESSGPMPAGKGISTVQVDLVDEWARLAQAGAPGEAAAGAGELFGPRLHRVLDAAGHRDVRDIEPGTMTMQATTLTTTPTTELQKTADSEGGWVWVDATGAILGRGRRFLVEDTRATVVQATFSDTPTGSECHYRSYKRVPAGASLHTAATYTRVGGVQQTYVDQRARSLHGLLRAERSDLLNDNDADVHTLAVWRVAMDSVAQSSIAEVEVRPRSHGGVDMTRLLGLREWDLVRFIRHKPGGYTVDRYVHIVGISHDMDVEGNWRIIFKFADATVPLSYANSRWNVGQWATSPSDPNGCKWYPG